MRFGGVCCVPSALRTRKRTIAILRKAVVVTAISGMSPSPTPSATSASRLGLRLSIFAETQHPHTETLADADQLAAAHPLTAGDDVDRLFRVAPQGEHMARSHRAQL